MQVLFLAGRELEYQRNDVLLRAFHRIAHVEVVRNELLFHSLVWNSFWIMLFALPRLLTGKYDLIFVGFYGHLLMIPVGIIAQFRKIPILFDVFVSNYDTLVQDRQTISSKSLFAKLAIWLDRTSCQLANHLLLDTQLHIDFFVELLHLPPEKLSVLPVGCNEDIFFPTEEEQNSESTNECKVLYYCTYLPLHGADIVVQAAQLLIGEPIHFRLIGTGPEYSRVRQMATGFDNIRFNPTVSLEVLRDEISHADICLGGHFGVSDKAGRVIPGKVYQILAVARPLIASDSPANRVLFGETQSAILIPAGDPQALAKAILTLHSNSTLRQTLLKNSRKLYKAHCSERIITERLTQILQKLLY